MVSHSPASTRIALAGKHREAEAEADGLSVLKGCANDGGDRDDRAGGSSLRVNWINMRAVRARNSRGCRCAQNDAWSFNGWSRPAEQVNNRDRCQ